MAKLFIEDLDLGGKRVIMRVDFNVPLKDGTVENDKRLRAALPSIKYVLDQGASLVLMSHLGRPNGQKKTSLSLAPVASRLSALLGRKVTQLDDCVGPEVEATCAALKPGDEIITSLDFRKDGGWQRVGKEIRYRLREGAPFTFGRALGLGNEPIDHGTQLYIDGVAVFNRVLKPQELKTLAFNDVTHTK